MIKASADIHISQQIVKNLRNFFDGKCSQKKENVCSLQSYTQACDKNSDERCSRTVCFRNFQA